MTEAQKAIADYIIDFFKSKNGVTMHQDTILQSAHNYDKSDVRYVLKMLLYKELLQATDGVNGSVMFLTDKGWIYESYDKLLEYEAYKRDLERRQMQSVLDTNKSVEATNKTQQKVLWISIGLAALTLATQIWDINTKQTINVAPSTMQTPNLIIDKDSTALRIYKGDSLRFFYLSKDSSKK
jgi:hypothetical protein